MQSGLGQGVFLRSARLLISSPIIVVPGLVVGAIAAIFVGLLEPAASSLGGNFFLRFVQDVVRVVATILVVTYTTGMADKAWRLGATALIDGTRAFTPPVMQTMLALLVAGIVAALLSPFTLGLAYFAYLFLFIYALAAAVVGERQASAAVRESIDIGMRRPVPTILLVAGIVIVSVVTSVVAIIFADTPFVGPLLATVILQTVAAYVTLVIVGEYRALRDAGAV